MIRTHIPVGWIIALALVPAAGLAQTPKPTFAKDVAPIVYAKCAMCHRPGEVAPMSLMSYDEVRPWARAIKNKVVSRQMPPWYAEGEHGKWRNDRRLSQAEIDKVVAWVDAGAPRGNDSDMPAPPQLALGWNGPNGTPPDLIVDAPVMQVPADGESPWQYAYVKLPFQGDVWVAASQVVPGNRTAVHHVLVTAMTLPPNAQIDAEGRMKLPQGASVDPAGRVSTATATTPVGPPAGGAAGGGAPLGGFSAGWEPGVDAAISYGPGVAEHLVGTHLMFNLHYQTNGKATTDKTRVGLWLAKGPITHASQGPGGGEFGNETLLVNGQELTGRFSAQVTQDILLPGLKTVPKFPAGADNYRLTNLLPIRQRRWYSIQPHASAREIDEYTAVSDGREEALLNINVTSLAVVCSSLPVALPAAPRASKRRGTTRPKTSKPAAGPGRLLGRAELGQCSARHRGVVQLKTPITPTPPVQLSQRIFCGLGPRDAFLGPRRYSMASRAVFGSLCVSGRGVGARAPG